MRDGTAAPRARLLRWGLRGLGVGVVVCTVVLVDWGSLWALWVKWADGPVTGERLWGIRVLWWGRLGKLLQFVAGLVAVIDLIGPERLRRWGAGWTERADLMEKRIGRTSRGARLLDDVGLLEALVKSDLGRLRTEIPSADELRERELPILTDVEYRSLLTDVLAAFGGDVRCGSCRETTVWKGTFPVVIASPGTRACKWACVHGRDVLEPIVKAAVLGRLTVEDRTALEVAAKVHRRTPNLGLILALLLVVGLAVLWRLDASPVVTLLFVPVFFVVSVFGMLASDPGSHFPASAILLALRARIQRLPKLAAETIAHQLDLSRPGHPIFMAALILVGIGFHFDFLAG